MGCITNIRALNKQFKKNAGQVLPKHAGPNFLFIESLHIREIHFKNATPQCFLYTSTAGNDNRLDEMRTQKFRSHGVLCAPTNRPRATG